MFVESSSPLEYKFSSSLWKLEFRVNLDLFRPLSFGETWTSTHFFSGVGDRASPLF